MKIYTLTLLFVSLLIMSCGKDDDEDPPLVANYFTVELTQYETSTAYLIFESAWAVDIITGQLIRSYNNGFAFVFTDGDVLIHDEELLLNSNTMQATYFYHESEEDPVDTVEDIQVGTQSYPLNDDSNIGVDLVNFTADHMSGLSQYGIPEDGQFYFESERQLGFMTINDIALDYTASTGTVDMIYTLIDENNETITGTYQGRFEILVND